MRTRVRALVTWFTVGAVLAATAPISAQQHVVDPAMIHQAIADQHATDRANRQLVERVLATSEAEAMAARMGLDLKDARTAIGQRDGQDLEALAQQARAVESDLAGGQRTIVISLTTLLLIIIIILLIAD
jgi:hypothetical protein